MNEGEKSFAGSNGYLHGYCKPRGQLYRNPNQASFIITCNYPNSLQLRILNDLGSVIREHISFVSGSPVYLDNVAAGVYQVMILNDNQLLKVSKVVKQ